jgi:hypothetical protein
MEQSPKHIAALSRKKEHKHLVHGRTFHEKPSFPARGDSAIASRSIFAHTLADRNESRQTARRATPGSMRECSAIPGRNQQRPARGDKRSECHCRQRQPCRTVDDEQLLINCPNQTDPDQYSERLRTVRSRDQARWLTGGPDRVLDAILARRWIASSTH